jgi:hypothetical protein
MPEISRFFGIIIRMFFDEHSPPHIHGEYQGHKAVFDLNGNIMQGGSWFSHGHTARTGMD